jgi:phosphatidylserine/phosphatidylglycerophosphate/cardiolipin synthase-like enzyme
MYHRGMFSVGPSLARAALSPTSPVSSLSTGAAIAVCFSPGEDCTAFAARAIDAAERQILVNAYALTTGSGIMEALIRAQHRGVDVKLIADKSTPVSGAAGSSR